MGGGLGNTASIGYATVGGGALNTASGSASTVSGGFGNQAIGDSATVPGGSDNSADGQSSFAAGNNAQALHDGAFVWADSSGTPFGSTTSNQFNVRASGGVRFVTSGAGMTLDGQTVLTTGSGISLQQNSSGAPNVIEGAAVNFVAANIIGATIGGGGAVNLAGTGYTNSVTGHLRNRGWRRWQHRRQ